MGTSLFTSSASYCLNEGRTLAKHAAATQTQNAWLIEFAGTRFDAETGYAATDSFYLLAK
jgi:hypothetical protein